MSAIKDTAEYNKWIKWHNTVKKELKRLISEGAELDKIHHLGKEMDWGRLDSYKPDLTWKKNEDLSFFEVEYYYNQDKIVRDIVYAGLLDTNQLVFIFSNKETDWGIGKKRVQATYYVAQSVLHIISKPLTVKALFIENIEEIEQKLKQAGIL